MTNKHQLHANGMIEALPDCPECGEKFNLPAVHLLFTQGNAGDLFLDGMKSAKVSEVDWKDDNTKEVEVDFECGCEEKWSVRMKMTRKR